MPKFIQRIIAVSVSATLGLSGCESLMPDYYKKPASPDSLKIEKVSSEPPPAPLAEAQTDMLKKPEYYPRKGSVVNPPSSSGGGYPGSATSSAGGGATGKGGGRTSPRKEGKYTLNFDDADLSEVTKVILGDTLKVNYVLSPKVTGKVSLQTTRPLTEDEMIPTLETLLRMNGAALIRDGGMYKIEPDAQAAISASGPGVGRGMMEPGYQLRVVPLRYISAQEMQKVLEPIMPPKAVLRMDETRNLVMVAGTAEELGGVMEAVQIFDVDYMRGMSVAIYPVKNADVPTIAEELTKVLGLGGKGAMGNVLRILPIERLNAILAVAPEMHHLQEVQDWIERLDRYNTTRTGNVHVYRCQHVDATELARTLGGIFGGGAGKSGPSLAPGLTGMDVSSGSSSAFGSASSAGFGGTSSGTGYGGSGSSFGGSGSSFGGTGSSTGSGSTLGGSSGGMGSSTGGSSGGLGRSGGGMGGTGGGLGTSGGSFGGGRSGAGGQGTSMMQLGNNARVVADPSNNALIVIAKPQDWKEIEAVIQALDILPLQVLIDATIVEISLVNDLKYGLKWLINSGSSHSTMNSNILSTFKDFFGTAGGFSYAFIANGGNVKVLLNMLASENLVNVISSPSLMVLNNQQAKINVGDQVPVLTGTGSTTINTTSQFNQYQQQQSGVTLQIRPRVNSGGLVSLDVFQSISTPTEITLSGGADGTKSFKFANREIQSTVAVPNGETLALGGLISDKRTEDQSGIPYMNKLPMIGWMFGSTEIKPERTELVVLITPRVVEKKGDINAISNEFRRRLTNLYKGEPDAQPAPVEHSTP
ncbi:type II secretion system secretin GspD [Methylococcus mesophilus]|uniref:type II secretion system secretin GspD n=1 Tax=Methylococcus mesophilus TaxID=2993564 RepID=UPI00224A4DE5|nr:type II secretion system secretin GspD [Methylococcus mesophilus]UZR28681.1 type II secretion system secretin GspD [Methylococcus mesophilus]